MAVVDVYLNGTDIQTSNIVLSTIGDDSAPNQTINLQQVSRRDGARLMNATFDPKTIVLTGRVKGTTQADLEANIDTFKKVMAVVNGALDIQYAGGVRRFMVSMDSLSIQRASYHLTFAPFVVTLRSIDPPFGLNVTGLGGNLSANEALSALAITSQAYSSTLSFDGSAQARPIIHYFLDTVGALGRIDELVVGQRNAISVGTVFANGDEVIIDTETQRVLRNGRQVNFEGMFPEYMVGDVTTRSIFSEGDTVIDQQQIDVTEFVTITNDSNHQFQGFQVSASGTYFAVDIYLRRDANTKDGTITLDIRDSSGNNPGPNTIANSSKTMNISDIPVEGGFFQFLFATPPTLSISTDYRAVLRTSGLNGKVYMGLSNGNPYGSGVYGFSNNAGSTWRSEDNIDVAFRIWKTSSSINWSIDKKVEYVKRYL